MKTYKIQSEWTGKSAGGCLNNATWRQNPQLFLTVKAKQKLKLKLIQNGTTLHHIGFYVARVTEPGVRLLVLTKEILFAKAGFEEAKELVQSVTFDAGSYVVIPCTFNAGEECKFTMGFSFSGTEGPKLEGLTPQKEWSLSSIEGSWEKGLSAGGCRNYPTCATNPQFYVRTKKAAAATIILSQRAKSDFDTIGFYVVRMPADGGGESSAPTYKTDSVADVLAKSDFESAREACVTCTIAADGHYAIVPATFDPNWESSFTLYVYSDNAVKLSPLKDARTTSVAGEWNDETAGGCVNTPRWRENPQFFLYLKRPEKISVTLRRLGALGEGKAPPHVGFYIARSRPFGQAAAAAAAAAASSSSKDGDVSRLIVFKQDDLIAKGAFTKDESVTCDVQVDPSKPNCSPLVVIPCTFHPNFTSRFSLAVKCHGDNPRGVVSLLPCNYGGARNSIRGAWKKPSSAGGCRNHKTWFANPQYALRLGSSTSTCIVLNALSDKGTHMGDKSMAGGASIGFYVFSIKDGKSVDTVQAADLVLKEKSPFRSASEVYIDPSLDAGMYVIVPCTFEPGQEMSFELSVYTKDDSAEVQLGLPSSDIMKKAAAKPASATPADAAAGGGGGGDKKKPAVRRYEDKVWDIDWNQLEVKEKIGRGAFGIVYRGYYKGEEVAIKKLFREEMNEDDLTSFKVEIDIMSKLQHRNIVGFVGASTEYPNVCVLSEFCHKGSLSNLLQDEPNLDWARKLKIAIDSAIGMIYLHNVKPKAIVHRDLKSLNLLVTKDYVTKVADFGLSKTTTGQSLNSKVGSLNWCAPEVILHNAPYTPQADVYSFGMVLWELITHEAPFTGMHPLQIVRAIDSGNLPAIPAGTRPAFKKLIEDCWETSPTMRPTFPEILQSLEDMLAEEEGRPVPERTAKPSVHEDKE